MENADLLVQYMQHACVLGRKSIQEHLYHPTTGTRIPQRFAFVKLRSGMEKFFSEGAEPRMVGLVGIRGVGKTSLLWQIADHGFGKLNKPVYYFDVQRLSTFGISLALALELFQQKVLKKRWEEVGEPFVLLFDEVHEDSDWARVIKTTYETARGAYILCTGSSALLLQYTADLARRMSFEKLYPFKYTEYILSRSDSTIYPIRGLAGDLKQALFYSPTAEEAFYKLKQLEGAVAEYYFEARKIKPKIAASTTLFDFVYYHNIPSFLNFLKPEQIYDAVFSLFERIISDDLPLAVPGFDKQREAQILLYRLAFADEINAEKLGQDTGLKKEVLEQILTALASAEIMLLLNPYGNAKSKTRKNKKGFFMSPAFRAALIFKLMGEQEVSKRLGTLLEDMVAMYLYRTLPEGLLSYTTGGAANPDFVIETGEKPLVLEVGLSKTKTQQLVKGNQDARYGILVTNGVDTPELKGSTLLLPIEWFFLL